jgi:hypothetical protein
MSCEYVQERISPLLDQRIAPGERETVLAHIESCRTCGERYESMQSLRAALRGATAPPMPAELRQKLRVLASHEHARRVSRLTLQARLNHWTGRMRLLFDNIMRPFGLPAASGLVSAMLLFALLAPSLSFARRGGADDPSAVATDAQLTAVNAAGDGPQIEDPDSFGSNYEAVLELKISPDGKVWNWSVLQGSLTSELKDMILFSRFQPATYFGQPTWGMVTIYYRHSFTYIVRG